MKLFFILFIAISLLTSCVELENRPLIKNNSNYSISFELLPDTIFRPNHPQYYVANKILPGKTGSKAWRSGKRFWSSVIEYYSVNQKLNVFIFPTDAIIKYGCIEYIIKNHLYTRYSFTVEELDEMDWVIVYP